MHNRHSHYVHLMAVIAGFAGWLAMISGSWGDTPEFEKQLKEVQKALRKPSSPGAIQRLLDETLEIIDAAMLDDKYALASRAVVTAQEAAQKLKSKHAEFRVNQRKEEIKKISSEYKKLASLLKKLSTDADDANANKTVGLFRVLIADQLLTGAPLLEKSKVPALVELGRQEQQKQTEVAGQMALAKLWKSAATEETGLISLGMERRAYYWYQQALRQATGKERDEISLAMDEFSFRYLTDMQETVTKPVAPFGKYGNLRGETPIQVDGIGSEFGLGMGVGKENTLVVQYELNAMYKTFQACCALQDGDADGRDAGGGIVFSVVGDGRVLWRSSPLKPGNKFEISNVDIKRVRTLELITASPDQIWGGHGVWLDPILLK